MLLWVTVAQMAISLIVTFSRLSPDDDSSFWPAVFGVLLIYLATLVPRIAAGSNWARVAVVLFAAFGVLFDATSFPAILSTDGPMATLDLVGDATLVAVVYLILVGPGATWFNRHSR
jgi:hypothetical protein